MILRENFLKCDEFCYVTYDMVKEHHTQEEYENFCEWMCGQTCSLVDGKCAIYAWDYERWTEQGKKTQQGPDWD